MRSQVNVGRALQHVRKLETFTLGWGLDMNRELADAFLDGVVKALLESDNVSSSGTDFVWEDHYSLRTISTRYKTWEMMSKPEKGSKKHYTQLKDEVSGRSVWAKEVQRKWTRDDLYGPSTAWVCNFWSQNFFLKTSYPNIY